MQTLAPRSAYDDDELGINRRTPLIVGGIYAVGMAGAFYLFSVGYPLGVRLLIAAVAGAVGVAFGRFVPWALWRAANSALDRAYAGDPTVVATPEPGYAYRLPCGWIRPPRQAVGGVLYLGRRGLRFDPYLRNPAGDQQPVVMEPLEELEFALVQAPLPPFFYAGSGKSVSRVEVRHGSRVEQFTVPAPAATFARLRESVDLLLRS